MTDWTLSDRRRHAIRGRRAVPGQGGRRRAGARVRPVLPRGPRRARLQRRVARARTARPGPFTRMRPGEHGLDRWHATIRPDAVGVVELHRRGVQRPVPDLADAVPRRSTPARASRTWPTTSPRAADPGPRRPTLVPKQPARPGPSRGRRGAARRRPPARRAGLPRARPGRPALGAPGAGPGHRRRPVPDLGRPASGRSSPPGTSSSPAPRARCWPPAADRPGTAPSRPRPAGCRRSRRWASTCVYLPPIHPIGRVNRKGRNNTLVAGPDDVGLAVGDRRRRGRPRRDPPRPGHRWRTSAGSSRPAAEHGLEVALDLALQCAPDHPWVTEHPEWFTTRAGRQHRVRGEPAQEIPGHLPAELRQRPGGHPGRDAAGGAALGRRRASRSSGSTTRTPSRSTSGTG